jgi:hypothetical protein
LPANSTTDRILIETDGRTDEDARAYIDIA